MSDPTFTQEQSSRMSRVLNRLMKWRSIFAGWQLGDRPDNDGQTMALRDQIDDRLSTRVEVSVLFNLCLRHGVFTPEEYAREIEIECEYRQKLYEKKFPGVKATNTGLQIDAQKFLETTRRLNFPR